VRASPFSARAPARDTPANLPAASCAIRRRAINPDANLRAAIERVVISRTTIEIELAESAAEDNQNRILIIPWTPPSPYLRRQIIQGESDQSSTARPMRTKARSRLIDALRDAHRWRHELTNGADGRGEGFCLEKSLESTGRSRRKPAVADRDLGRLNWAGSAPTGVSSGRTGIRAIADIQLRARSTLHRPKGTSKRRADLRADFGARRDRTGPLRPPRQLEGRPDCRMAIERTCRTPVS
jgi:hypothetical protein